MMVARSSGFDLRWLHLRVRRHHRWIEIESWSGGWLNLRHCLIEEAQIHRRGLIEAISFTPYVNSTALDRAEREGAERKIAPFTEKLAD